MMSPGGGGRGHQGEAKIGEAEEADEKEPERDVPQHAAHPPLRGEDGRVLHGGPGEGGGAREHRPGGVLGRRLRGAERRGRHPDHPPGPRALHRQGHPDARDDGRASRQVHRPLQGARRLHAHRRHLERPLRGALHRGGEHADGHGDGPRLSARRLGPRGGGLLRRRGVEPGQLP